jgi:phosphoenolpyruvate synthase/pyruvate phosphate dikinase
MTSFPLRSSVAERGTGRGGAGPGQSVRRAREDSEQASFAGQFETVLGVEADGLADAVRRVWRSAFSERVTAMAASKAPDRWPSSSSP